MTLSLREIVGTFSMCRVLVMGDPMFDEYHFGHVDRLSPEAPIPVFVEDRSESRQGGALNVAANLKALGCVTSTLLPPAPFTIKHRFLVGAQQVFRIDRDKDHKGQVTPAWQQMPDPLPQVIVISDYGKGWCSHERCKEIIQTARINDIPVIVDPKGKCWEKYQGATVICPNEREFAEREATLGWRPKAIVHKRGPEGLELLMDGEAPLVFPARARHVFDVTGAGDTVVAVMAAALAAGAELHQAAELANIAAGIVVGEVGTSTCGFHRLLEEI